MNFKILLAAAAFALAAPFAANAALVDICEDPGNVLAGAPFDVDSGDTFNCDFTTQAANGSIELDFVSNNIPSSAMAANINLSLFGTYTSAILTWSETGGVDLKSVNVPINTFAMLDTVFSGPAPDLQTLTFTWTGFSGDGLDVNIQVAAVPVPAGILLMGTALAGFGVMRRRRKAA